MKITFPTSMEMKIIGTIEELTPLAEAVATRKPDDGHLPFAHEGREYKVRSIFDDGPHEDGAYIVFLIEAFSTPTE